MNLTFLNRIQNYLQWSKGFYFYFSMMIILFLSSFQYATRTSDGFELVQNKKTPSIDPSCTPSAFYRTLGVRVCLELNPFRSIQFGKRNSYPLTVSVTIKMNILYPETNLSPLGNCQQRPINQKLASWLAF